MSMPKLTTGTAPPSLQSKFQQAHVGRPVTGFSGILPFPKKAARFITRHKG